MLESSNYQYQPNGVPEVLGTNLSPEIGQPEKFREFPQSSQANARMNLELEYDLFITYHFQLTVH
jgi:hypothetical protein